MCQRDTCVDSEENFPKSYEVNFPLLVEPVVSWDYGPRLPFLLLVDGRAFFGATLKGWTELLSGSRSVSALSR